MAAANESPPLARAVYAEYLGREEEFRDLAAVAVSLIEACTSRASLEATVEGRHKAPLEVYRKQLRKHYSDPWTECPDLIGARIIVPLARDKVRVVSALTEAAEFEVFQVEDQTSGSDPLSLRYAGLHVHAWVNHAGTRQRCEIQIRTEAEHAWSSVEHHFIYKKPMSIPPKARRTFSRLLVLVELLDAELSRGVTMIEDLPEYRRFKVAAGMQETYFNLTQAATDETLTMDVLAQLETLDLVRLDDLPSQVEAFAASNRDRVHEAVRAHGPESPGFDPDSDWLFAQPELLILWQLLDQDEYLLRDRLRTTDLYKPVEVLAIATGHEDFAR